MVNLPQDLLTVGSNVCDFWICVKSQISGEVRLLEEIHIKVQVIESHHRMQATICIDKILVGSSYLILNSVFKFMDDIGPLFIFMSPIFAESFHVR